MSLFTVESRGSKGRFNYYLIISLFLFLFKNNDLLLYSYIYASVTSSHFTSNLAYI